MINREDDDDFLEREFLKIDAKMKAVRRQMVANENSSNLTTYSQPVIRRGSSYLDEAINGTESKPSGR